MNTPIHKLSPPLILLAAAVLSAGCQSTPKPSQPTARVEEISFPRAFDASRTSKVTNENDANQLIGFAMNLAERGRHDEAAKFFKEAADKFVSRDNELVVACRAAQAAEHFLANDIAAFRRAVVQLKGEMNRFQGAGADGPLAAVLALGDIAQGSDRPTSVTPPSLRDLYPAAKGTANPPSSDDDSAKK